MTTGEVTAASEGFVGRHGLWTPDQRAAAEELRQTLTQSDLRMVRICFTDLHGKTRSKALTVPAFIGALTGGHGIPGTLLLKDTSGRTVYPVFDASAVLDRSGLAGARDVLLVPDPATFKVLPWAADTGWVLCSVHFADGRPVPLDVRAVYQRLANSLADRGYDYLVGLEVEFHVFKAEPGRLDPAAATWPGEPPAVSLLDLGYQLASEERLDALDPVVRLVRATADALDLGLRSVEVELGPSQLEATFSPRTGLRAADDLVLFRSAVRQVCRRNGYHATFMCLPHLPNVVASGWHLHQSLRNRADGANVFASGSGDWLSPIGRGFLAGILSHARGAAVFTTPTINGYKRYRPRSLAPYNINWGLDNRGAMVRLIGGGASPLTHLENRVGDPAANPYLYLASQLVSGLDGVDRGLDPGDPTEAPYDPGQPRLPAHLIEAVAELRCDEIFATVLGPDFVGYVLTIKQAEIDRFLSSVTDWEQREYFDLF